MAEVIASDLVTGVVGKLGSALWDEIGLLRSFKDDADDLRSNFSAIQAVLLNAEEKSNVEKENHALRNWLLKLKGAAYDIDDLLDEIQTQALLRKQQREVQNQNQLAKNVCAQFLSCANPIHLKFKFQMAHRMKELRKKMDKIAKQSHDFHLVEAGPGQQPEMIVRTDDRETISVVDEEKIVGREDDKEKIVKLLLETGGDHDVSVIPIVGLGGLGKTTLAQLAFNDKRVTPQQVFDPRVWVYVPTDFDMKKIAEAVKSITRGEGHLTTKESSTSFLRDTFSQKKFLLVLDDVWNEDQGKWEDLKVLFKDGMKGSKILVTTRSEKVAEIMKTTEQPHRLEGLSDDDCWELFRRLAFKEGEENGCPNLVEIKKQIVMKCGGVPLAAKALGSMMRFEEKTDAIWSYIINSQIWMLETKKETREEDKILPSLKLSYIHMRSSALKECFAYCSIFPKGYIIDKDDLIQQWIALGFISSHEKNSTLMEDIGNKYFKELLRRYFLQEVEDNKKFNGKVTYRMHDLMHDLAQYVARGEVAVRVGEESTEIPEGCRYASIHSRSIQQVPTTVKQRLRALQFGESASLTTFYSEAKCLRLLALHGFKISMLPSSIGKLKLLRYLNLSSTNIQELPESITGLCNLQTLNLSFCHRISTFPKSLGSLANLLFLDLSSCYNLTLLDSISNLQNLYKLNLSSCRELRSLEPICDLKNLHDLNLSSLRNLQELPDSIESLENLRFLDLSYSLSLLSLPESIGSLKNLRFLNLSTCYRLLSLPSSLCQLKNLYDLNLSRLGNLQALPESIGNLENLRILNLSKCSRLLSLPSSLCQLKNLHDLNLSNLGSLRASPEFIGNLENLRILNLFECSRLLSLPSSLCQLKNLHDLNLSNLGDLQALPESIGNLENLRILNLSRCSRLQLLPSSLCQLKNLHDLNLSHLGSLRALPESIGNLEKLRILNLSYCSSLLSLPSSLCQLKNLHDLNLFTLDNLKALPESIGNLENLRILNLSECSSLLSLPSSSSELRQLEKLDIRYCQKLCELPKMIENLTKLRELLNNDCLELKGMPRGIGKLVSLQKLPFFVIGKQGSIEHCASISELKQLNNLGGELRIRGLENVMNPVDAKDADLIEKKLLRSLELEWNVLRAAAEKMDTVQPSEKMDTVQPSEKMDAVLENLRPHQNFAKLVIEGFAGGKFPSWMMNSIDSCLPNLVEIKLVNIPRCSSLPPLGLLSVLKDISIENMPRCSSLPPLGQLPLLEELRIRNMAAITNLGVEFDGDSHINESASKFPALRRLYLSDMPELREWVPVDDEEGRRERVPIFPRLAELTLERCPKLRASVESLRSFTTLESLTITDWEDLKKIGELTELMHLDIEGCRNLWYLPVHKMTTLTYLRIEDCPLLFNAGGDVRVNERPERCLPSSVQILVISGISKECLSLILKRPTMDSETLADDGDAVSLQQPNMVMLRELIIKKCQQLTCLPECLRSFTSLEYLAIGDCEDLERIEDWLGELTKLKRLSIRSCQNLCYLPAHKMTTLEKLYIIGCPRLFNADEFIDTNVDHIVEVRVDGSEYKYKKEVSNS